MKIVMCNTGRSKFILPLRCSQTAAARRPCGQGTVEYALVTAVFVAVWIAVASFWHGFESGLFVEHALAAASHHVQLTATGTIADIFLY